MFRAGLVAVLLSGCALDMDVPSVSPDRPVGALPVSYAYPDELDEATAAWLEHFAMSSDCDADRVYVAEVEADTCSGVSRPGGCVLVHRSPLWTSHAYTIAVYDSSSAGSIVARELRIWLKLCNGGALYATAE